MLISSMERLEAISGGVEIMYQNELGEQLALLPPEVVRISAHSAQRPLGISGQGSDQ